LKDQVLDNKLVKNDRIRSNKKQDIISLFISFKMSYILWH